MGLLSIILPTLNAPDATEDPKINTALTAIQTLVNGNLDGTNNLAAGAAMANLGGDTGWQVFSYVNSWASNSGPATGATAAGYRRQGNTVRLAGSISGGSSGVAFATLPAGYRPTYNVPFGTRMESDNTDPCEIVITTGGVCTAYFGAGSLPSLDPITFTVD